MAAHTARVCELHGARGGQRIAITTHRHVAFIKRR